MAKGLLPYHGIGSGIKRALSSCDWPDITFADDHDGCLFTATVRRKAVRALADSSPITPQKSSEKSSEKTDSEILHALANNPRVTISELAASLGLTTRAVEKQLATLKKLNRLRRVGPDKGGHWEVTG